MRKTLALSDNQIEALRDAVGTAISITTKGVELNLQIAEESGDSMSAHVAKRLQKRIELLRSILDEANQPSLTVDVAAYVPANAEHAVLLATVDDVAVGLAFRRGDAGYDLLKRVCNGQPKWLFGQSPSPLE